MNLSEVCCSTKIKKPIAISHSYHKQADEDLCHFKESIEILEEEKKIST